MHRLHLDLYLVLLGTFEAVLLGTFEAVLEEQYADHSYVCPQVVLLGESNIALFAFRFIFGLIGDL